MKQYKTSNTSMSNIELINIDVQLRLIPTEVITRFKTPETIKNKDYNKNCYLHTNGSTHFVLAISRED